MTFKKINQEEKIFHYMKLSPTKYAIFDSEMDVPIMYGSKNKVDMVIKNLNRAVRVNYYNFEDGFLKLSVVFDKRKRI